MDRIIAIYPDATPASNARTQLFQDGIAADRLDVVSWQDPGRAAVNPQSNIEDALTAHFRVLLADDRDVTLVQRVVELLREGKAALVVHPRGTDEIEQANELLERFKPETVLWRVAPPEAQGGLLGERAAGPLA